MSSNTIVVVFCNNTILFILVCCCLIVFTFYPRCSLAIIPFFLWFPYNAYKSVIRA